MENYRNKSQGILTPAKKSGLIKNPYFIIFLSSLILSISTLILYFLYPYTVSPNHQKKSLSQLTHRKEEIKHRWVDLFTEIYQKKEIIRNCSLSSEKEIFKLFKKLNLDQDYEGIAFFDTEKKMVLWLGKVIELPPDIFTKDLSFFLKKNQTNIYLISIEKAAHGFFAFFKQIVFLPPVKSPYLKEFHYLKKNYKEPIHIQYIDYQENIENLEKFFKKWNDNYLSHQFQKEEKWSLLFPLRGPDKKILATITLNSYSRYSYLSSFKEKVLILFYLWIIFLIISFIFILISYYKKSSGLINLILGGLIIISLTFARLVLIFLSSLPPIKKLPFFSSSLSGFIFPYNLFNSPADIFLTFLYLFLILILILNHLKKRLSFSVKKINPIQFLLISPPCTFLSVFLLLSFHKILTILINNSNINLTDFSLNLSFILLHFSFLLFLVSISILILLILRLATKYSKSYLRLLILSILSALLLFLVLRFKVISIPVIPTILFLLFMIVLSFNFHWLKKKRFWIFGLAVTVLFIYLSTDFYSFQVQKKVLQNTIKSKIINQKNWGEFFLHESLLELDKEEKMIIEYFKNPEYYDISHYLWSKTPLAKFNWHSALEIINPEGEILSRFSLNMPIFYFAEFSFPLRDEWSIIEQEMPFLGKEKKVLIGYKDWFEGETLLGRTILYLSIDYDMLPFIRSQNPYSEILRAPFLPSFGRTEFGIAVFNTNGSLLFNPEKLSTGISPDLLTLINNSSKPIWSSFTDRGKKHQSLYFKFENRIYSLFYPLKSIKKYFVEYWKLFLSYLILFSFIISIYLFITKKTIKNPIWSFSNKVYLSFFIIAVLPLLLFSIFTKNFFTREFTEQFKEKAEAHLNFVHRVMEDFVSLQMEKEKGMKILPDDLVLWISSTISNDVNLYQNGRITSSSRRELFKIGLLPEIIAGETYYQILAENKPFDIRQEKIGTYSYYTLTVPALLFNKIFLLSLPFPYGQEEISEATQELIEFLVFASTFIIGLAFILARSMGSIILTPIKKLLSGTKQVSQGNLEVSINHKPKDEMKTLIDGFNTMVKNLKKQQEELSQISKKIAWAEMTKRVAHEIKNPLTPIQLSAEHILKVHQDKASNFDQALKESAEYIIKEVENLRKIAQKFLDFSREEALKKELFNLKEAFQEIIRPYKKLFSGKIKFIESYLTEELNIYGDKEKLKISFRNILINAIEAIRKKGEVEIKLKKGQNWVNIEIRDTGIGMEKDLLEKVFQPYFSTKDIGTGLGLPIAKKIIEEHGGQIKALSKLGEGTTVVIKLPIE